MQKVKISHRQAHREVIQRSTQRSSRTMKTTTSTTNQRSAIQKTMKQYIPFPTTKMDQGTQSERVITTHRTTHTRISPWSKTLRTTFSTVSSNRALKCCYGTIVSDIPHFRDCKRWPKKGYCRNDSRRVESLSAHPASTGK